MTVEELITRLVTLGPRYARYTIDVRIETGEIGDWRIVGLAEMDDSREPGAGWVTLFLDERPS